VQKYWSDKVGGKEGRANEDGQKVEKFRRSNKLGQE
jgi:hypothetical protein